MKIAAFLLVVVTVLCVLVFLASKDPHDYDVDYIPVWDFNLNCVVMQPDFVHKKDCRYCATNTARLK